MRVLPCGRSGARLKAGKQKRSNSIWNGTEGRKPHDRQDTGYAALETTGRKSGKSRRTPVGDGRIGKQFWLVAEHGMKAGYVLNIARTPRVRLKLRDGLRVPWHTGTAHLLSDDDPRERQLWLATNLPSSAGNSRAVRLFGTQLLTVPIDLDG